MFSQSLYPVMGTCSGNELCWQSCAGKKVLSWLWKHAGECPHPQVSVLVIKHQPGGLVTEPSGVRLCSGSSVLYLLQSWSPRLSCRTCSGGSVPEGGSPSWGPCPGLCVLCVTACVPATAAPGVRGTDSHNSLCSCGARSKAACCLG